MKFHSLIAAGEPMWPLRHDKPPNSAQPSQRVLSLLTPEEVQSLGGLPSEAILGVYAGPHESLETFRPNRTFIDFLHRVIADHGSRSAELAAGARQQQNGWLYVIDPRTPEGPNGNVSPEDIIGAFEVRDGTLVQGSYQPNANYRVLTILLPPRPRNLSNLLRPQRAQGDRERHPVGRPRASRSL